MSTSPEEPITDPTEFPDSGPDLDPEPRPDPGDDEQSSGSARQKPVAYNPFAPGEPFSPAPTPVTIRRARPASDGDESPPGKECR